MLLVDLYEFTMLEAFASAAWNDNAVFDLYVRDFPPTRNYLIAPGLEDALNFLESLAFADDDIA